MAVPLAGAGGGVNTEDRSHHRLFFLGLEMGVSFFLVSWLAGAILY